MNVTNGQKSMFPEVVPDVHTCRRCGRNLTSEDSITAGIGKCCEKKEEGEGMKNDMVIENWLGYPEVRDAHSADRIFLPYSQDANLWFGQDGLLKRAKQGFGSRWIIASMRLDWEQGPSLWAKTLAEMIEEVEIRDGDAWIAKLEESA